MYYPTEEDGKHVLNRLWQIAWFFCRRDGFELDVGDYLDEGLLRIEKAIAKAQTGEEFRAIACNGAWHDMRRTREQYRRWRDCSKKGYSLSELESKAEPRVSYAAFIGRHYLDPWIALMLHETYAKLDPFEMICVFEVWIEGESLREVSRRYRVGRKKIRMALASAREKFKFAIHGG